MKMLAAVMVLMLAACASGSDHAEPQATIPTVVVPTTLRPIGPGSVCTKADLATPALAMPTPQRITKPVVLADQYGARLDPAPKSAEPRVAAEAAWNTLTDRNPQLARSGELLFGMFSASIPFGLHGPEKLRQLAWVLRVHGLASALPEGGSGGGTALNVRSDCQFVNGYLVVDATTGARVISASFPL